MALFILCKDKKFRHNKKEIPEDFASGIP